MFAIRPLLFSVVIVQSVISILNHVKGKYNLNWYTALSFYLNHHWIGLDGYHFSVLFIVLVLSFKLPGSIL